MGLVCGGGGGGGVGLDTRIQDSSIFLVQSHKNLCEISKTVAQIYKMLHNASLIGVESLPIDFRSHFCGEPNQPTFQ